MRIAIVTLEGFNEIDSFVSTNMLGRVRREPWRVHIAAPSPRVTSMNGVTVASQMSFDELPAADAVIVGSGTRTREYACDATFLASICLDPARQLIGSQCSGALLLWGLGLLADSQVCTDLTTRPWLVEAGATVVDRPFHASGNVATAGGCLASHYLATWIITRLAGADVARSVLRYVAPVGEQDDYVDRAMGHVLPFVGSVPAEV
jgi:transcriptional regulator GlxA family with amidase domain